jgi:hypothetical protein
MYDRGNVGADEAVLMHQRCRSRRRLYERGVDNTGGGGGRSPSSRSWDGTSRTLEDASTEGSCGGSARSLK